MKVCVVDTCLGVEARSSEFGVGSGHLQRA